MNVFYPVGVDDMAAGLCGIPRMVHHHIPYLDHCLVLLLQVLLTANTGGSPSSHTGSLTPLTVTLATTTTQVDHVLESRHVVFNMGKCRLVKYKSEN